MAMHIKVTYDSNNSNSRRAYGWIWVNAVNYAEKKNIMSRPNELIAYAQYLLGENIMLERINAELRTLLGALMPERRGFVNYRDTIACARVLLEEQEINSK